MSHNYESDLIQVNLFLQSVYQKVLNQKIKESKKTNTEDEMQSSKAEMAEWLSDNYKENSADIESLICIMALEYYNYAYDDEEDEIVQLMNDCSSKDEFLDEVWNNLDILYNLIEHEVYVYRPEGYSYRFANEILKTSEGREMYYKFHPNYRKEIEYNEFWQKHHDSKDFEIINFPVHNFFEFYLVMMHVVETFEDRDEASLVVSDIWENIAKKDSNVAESILNEVIKYYYLHATKKLKKRPSFIEQKISRLLEDKTRSDIIKDIKENDEMRFEMIQTFVNDYRIGLCPSNLDTNVKVFYKKMDNLSPKGE